MTDPVIDFDSKDGQIGLARKHLKHLVETADRKLIEIASLAPHDAGDRAHKIEEELRKAYFRVSSI